MLNEIESYSWDTRVFLIWLFVGSLFLYKRLMLLFWSLKYKIKTQDTRGSNYWYRRKCMPFHHSTVILNSLKSRAHLLKRNSAAHDCKNETACKSRSEKVCINKISMTHEHESLGQVEEDSIYSLILSNIISVIDNKIFRKS